MKNLLPAILTSCLLLPSFSGAAEPPILEVRCNLADENLPCPEKCDVANELLHLKTGESAELADYQGFKYEVAVGHGTPNVTLTIREASSGKAIASAYSFLDKTVVPKGVNLNLSSEKAPGTLFSCRVNSLVTK